MIVQIRDAKPQDQVVLQDCDLKCFYHPWDIDQWSIVGETHWVKVATIWGSIVGFAAGKFNEENKFVQVAKVCVKEQYRRRGVGTALMDEMEKFGLQLSAVGMMCLVPESFTDPNSPNNAAAWFKAMGWEATGMVQSLFKETGYIEDGIFFQREIRRGTNE